MKRSLGARTIAYPAPVFIVGSYGPDNTPNIMAASWGGICCSKPPCMTISLRKATLTYHNIMAAQAYTLSVPSVSHVREADYAGIVSGKTTNKFKDCGLTPVKSEVVNAPYVKEFPLVIECALLHTFEIGLHTQFIGEIRDVKIDEDLVDAQSKPDICRLDPLWYAPENREYFGGAKLIARAFSIGREIVAGTHDRKESE